MPGMTAREFATAVGVSHTAINKALAAGRIIRGPDGLIDPVKGVRDWEASRRAPPAARAAPEAAAPRQAPAAPAEGPTIARLQQAELAVKIEARKLDLDAKKGRLIDRAKAVALFRRLAQEERDAILNFPARVGAEIAAEFGADPHRMITVLDDYLRRHLAERGAITVPL